VAAEHTCRALVRRPLTVERYIERWNCSNECVIPILRFRFGNFFAIYMLGKPVLAYRYQGVRCRLTVILSAELQSPVIANTIPGPSAQAFIHVFRQKAVQLAIGTRTEVCPRY
jgi:hypothetical protein